MDWWDTICWLFRKYFSQLRAGTFRASTLFLWRAATRGSSKFRKKKHANAGDNIWIYLIVCMVLHPKHMVYYKSTKLNNCKESQLVQLTIILMWLASTCTQTKRGESLKAGCQHCCEKRLVHQRSRMKPTSWWQVASESLGLRKLTPVCKCNNDFFVTCIQPVNSCPSHQQHCRNRGQSALAILKFQFCSHTHTHSSATRHW